MSKSNIKVPTTGEKITYKNNKLVVPDNPIIPYIEGDGIGVDITPVMLNVIDAAVEKAYDGKRKISWMEIYCGEKSVKIYGNDEWLPDESRTSIYETLQEAFEWFIEDMKASDKENDIVLNNIFGFCPQLKENLDPDACQAIINDLIRIGKADGNYDEREQKWAEILSAELGVSAS